jgi:hypothetical protein
MSGADARGAWLRMRDEVSARAVGSKQSQEVVLAMAERYRSLTEGERVSALTNYVITVGNYLIVSPSELGNYKIADNGRMSTCCSSSRWLRRTRRCASTRSRWSASSGLPLPSRLCVV